MKKFKNIYIFLAIILVLVIIAIIIIAFKENKNFDLNEVKDQFISYYVDDNLVQVEKDNIDYYFSLPSSEMENVLLLSNFDPTNIEEEHGNLRLILLINDISIEKVDEYYDSLDGIKYVYSNNENINKEIASLYNNAILKRSTSYVYLILGEENKIMEDELKRLYK